MPSLHCFSNTISNCGSNDRQRRRHIRSAAHRVNFRRSKSTPVNPKRATSVKRINHVYLRSKEKVNTQWHLYCLVHNIEKLARSGCRG